MITHQKMCIVKQIGIYLNNDYINEFTYIMSDGKKYVPFLKKQVKAIQYMNELHMQGKSVTGIEISTKFKLDLHQLQEIVTFLESTLTQVISA